MAYAKDNFDFLNKPVKPIYNKYNRWKFQCLATDNKGYRAMQI